MSSQHTSHPSSLRIVFAGTPDFAARALAALLETAHEILAVYTQPDRPAGRGRQLKPSPVKQLALEHQLPVFQPTSLKTPESLAELRDLGADVMVVAAYGLLLPAEVLNLPRYGCLNIHASLLPRWRGAAPIQRAILAGDSETGITIMQMDAGLDTGAMLLKSPVPLPRKIPVPASMTGWRNWGPRLLLKPLLSFPISRRHPRMKARQPMPTSYPSRKQ